jgi:hypothetical protein
VNEMVKKDQGEFLEFDRIQFVNGVNEVDDTHALVASSPDEKSKFLDTQILSEITDQRGKVVWVVYKK